MIADRDHQANNQLYVTSIWYFSIN